MPLNYRRRYSQLIITLAILGVSLILGGACTASDVSTQPSVSQDGGLVIRYLTAPKQVRPSSGAEVLCMATDGSNSAISYEWSTTGGEIKKKGEGGDLVLWVAPDKAGSYTVTVVVTNAEGVKATRSTTILVTSEPSQQLKVTSVTCIGCNNGIEASRFKNYEIRCTVSAPDYDTLSYTWFANTGKIDGQGPHANWYTGGQYGNVLITVIVTDAKGNKTEGYLAINVDCCH